MSPMADTKLPVRNDAYFNARYTYKPAPTPKRKLAHTLFPFNKRTPSNSSRLGSGDYAQVNYAERAHGTPVAVKEQTRDIDIAEIEAKAMSQVNSKHVPKLIDVIKPDDNSIKLVMEYMPHGMSKHMEAGGALDEKQVWAVLAGAFKGANAVHRAGYVHDDIASRNVLADENGVVKLGDLGNVKEIGSGVSKSNDWRGVYIMAAQLFDYVGEDQLSGNARRVMRKGQDLQDHPHVGNPSKFGLQVTLLLANGLKSKTQL